MEYIKSEHYDHVRNDYGREMVIPSEKEWAEVKRGHWIRHGNPPWNVIECSECGAQWQTSGSWDAINYCPNCGSRMDKE